MNEESPKVTVVMPCYNEERYIGRAIESLSDKGGLENSELLVVDGGSTDGTKRFIEHYQKLNEFNIKLLDNPQRLQGNGLNIGIGEARGKIIVRADAHCVFPPGYVKNCVELLELKEKEGVANVGGVMKPLGTRLVQKSNAAALQHPLGVGDAKFHLGTRSGYLDTVYLGTFRKTLFEEIGLYDPQAHPNEDAELNLRILKARKKIYLDSSIKVIYYPRDSFRALAKQYFRYAQGRAYTTWKHWRLSSWRQAAPILLVLGLFSSFALSFFRPIFLLFPAAYATGITLSAFFWCLPNREERAIFPSQLQVRLLLPVTFVLMHISWGIGFLTRMLTLIFKKKTDWLENSSG